MNDPSDFHRPVRPPYVFQEFPRMLHQAGRKLVVHSTEEKEAAMARGWKLTPELFHVEQLGPYMAMPEPETPAVEIETPTPQVTEELPARGRKTRKAKNGE